MRSLVLAALATLLAAPAAFAAAPAPAATGAVYGAKPALESAPLSVADAVKPENLGHPVRVEGTATAVCQKKGCWLSLAAGETSVRVTFKDYGFFVPKDLAGKHVVVEGTLAQEKVSEKTQKHFAKDAGASKEEMAKIHGDQSQVSMVATSVVVK